MIIIIIATMRMIKKMRMIARMMVSTIMIMIIMIRRTMKREKQKKKENSARHYLRFPSDNVSDLRSNEHYLGSGV